MLREVTGKFAENSGKNSGKIWPTSSELLTIDYLLNLSKFWQHFGKN
jgi:hypothetical protein